MDLDGRLQEIERRLSALERRARPLPDVRERRPREGASETRAARDDPPAAVATLPPDPVGVPVPPPPSVDVPTGSEVRPRAGRTDLSSRRPAAAPRGDRLERFLGVTVLGRVGIAAILLAAAWFAQLAYQAIGPAWRVVSIEGLAAALTVVGFLVRPKVSTRFLAILWGGAGAAAYMAGAVARMRYHLVGPFEAVSMLVAACALGQWLAKVAGVRALAHVALAGAFAAPFLVGWVDDPRTFLLVYALVLHGWAAFTEAQWGWRGARLLAVVGATVTGLAWLAGYGDGDVSTCVHVHGYLIGLTAPEWIAALRGRAVPRTRARVAFGLLLGAEVVALVGFTWQVPEPLYRAFPLVAGAFWLGLAALARVRSGEAGPAVRGLARVGEVMLVAAAITAWPREWDFAARQTAVLAGLAVLGTAFAALRSRLGTGAPGPLLAIAASLLVLAGRTAPDPALALALCAPAALVVFGDPRVRPLGLGAGVVAIGLALGNTSDPWWPAIAFAATGAWLTAGYALAARRQDDLGRGASDLLWVVACLLWGWAVLSGPFMGVIPALFNPGTLAAAALAVVPWSRRRTGSVTDDETIEGAMRLALLGVLLCGAWREWHAFAAHVSTLALASWHVVAFLTAAGALVRATGGARFATLHRTVGLGLFLCAAGVVLSHAGEPGSAWAFAAELVLLAAPAAFLLRDARPSTRDVRSFFLLFPAVCWAIAALAGPLAHVSPLLANARFASAVLLAGALAFLRARDVPGRRATVLGAAAALLAYAGGLGETIDVVAGLEPVTLRHALVSVYSAAAAGVVLAVGFVRRAPDLRWLALLGFGAVIGKVGLHDLADAATSVRILVTGALGVVLLLSAYAYARRDRGAGGPATELGAGVPAAHEAGAEG